MAADLLRQPSTKARARLILLHGWGADAGDLMPLGQALAETIATPLELVALQAPQLQTQGSGRQWYGLFPADWAAVPAAVERLKKRINNLGSTEIPLEATVLLGFSQGGAMAMAAGCDLPLAGLIACSAYPHPKWQAPLIRPPVLLLHGRQDDVVPHSAALTLKEELVQSNQTCDLFSFDNGHAIPVEAQAEMKKALKRWLDQPAQSA
ncbi:alpha/beta hydrolase [Synechococcus sp. CC9311]|uniref:alpha/beta hydrolase n=1 Tax=Synechococcus sp. (strain CC9311) TaxID=64471 RepID=UPI0000DDAA30|nr:alpha/beta fold hydrolase [Synechococcus sp. CC9311]ABI45142.1 Predicted esterase [Synechococcus sp. CC9311]